MRGRWQGSGTFETDTGCGFFLLAALGLLGLAAVLAWVAARIWWIAGTALAAVTLAVAAVAVVMRAQRRRAAVHAREHPFLAVRQVAAVSAEPRRQLAAPVIIQNFYGADAAGLAPRAIRSTLPGNAGDTLAEERQHDAP